VAMAALRQRGEQASESVAASRSVASSRNATRAAATMPRSRAGATSGRAALISGVTVATAMAGMALSQICVLLAFGVAAITLAVGGCVTR
jgi:hypothetical protein